MNTKKLAKALKALSHPNRLELFLEIAQKEGSVYDADCGQCLISDIMGSLNVGAPTISHHIKELTNADLITTERKGKFLEARINKIFLAEIVQALTIN